MPFTARNASTARKMMTTMGIGAVAENTSPNIPEIVPSLAARIMA